VSRRAAAALALVASLAGGLAAAGCGTARRALLPEGAGGEVARGERVFMAHCHECHPGGEAGLGPALNNKPLPGFLVRYQVRHGLGAMPAFPPGEIDDGDLDALVVYLRARRGRPPGPGV
jgi:mono/diheme cytochrome c family protein